MKYAIIILLSFVLFSCKKEKLSIPGNPNYQLELQMPVHEQENVSHYDVQISTDGKEYSTIDVIKASKKTEDNYSATVDFALNQEAKIIYVRIVSVDIDGSKMYSPIMANYPEY